MKKALAIAASTVMLLGSVIMGASAATVDIKPVAELKNVFERSENWQYDFNTDFELGLYGRNKKGADEYLTFKVDGAITGFETRLFKCAGFFDEKDVTRDINFFVSPDNKNWTKVAITEGPTTFDEDIYLNEKTAYWFNSDVKSKAISGQNSYLKIVIKDSPVAGSPAWNILLDTIKVTTEPIKDTSGNNNTTNAPGSNDANKTTNNSNNTSSPATGESTAAATSLIVVSVLSAGVLMAVKSKKNSK